MHPPELQIEDYDKPTKTSTIIVLTYAAVVQVALLLAFIRQLLPSTWNRIFPFLKYSPEQALLPDASEQSQPAEGWLRRRLRERRELAAQRRDTRRQTQVQAQPSEARSDLRADVEAAPSYTSFDARCYMQSMPPPAYDSSHS